jgi:hypothetical protein
MFFFQEPMKSNWVFVHDIQKMFSLSYIESNRVSICRFYSTCRRSPVQIFLILVSPGKWQATVALFHILPVFGSHLSRNTSYPEVYLGFPQFLLENDGKIAQIRSGLSLHSLSNSSFIKSYYLTPCGLEYIHRR